MKVYTMGEISNENHSEIASQKFKIIYSNKSYGKYLVVKGLNEKTVRHSRGFFKGRNFF